MFGSENDKSIINNEYIANSDACTLPGDDDLSC